MTSGGFATKQAKSEEPRPPVRTTTTILTTTNDLKFVEGGLIMNERDVATPAVAGHKSHISAPHIPPPHHMSVTTSNHPVTAYAPNKPPTNGRHTYSRRKRTQNGITHHHHHITTQQQTFRSILYASNN